MARGHRLNTSIVLAAVDGLFCLIQAVSAVEPSLFRPLPLPLPVPSLISRLASVDVKQNLLEDEIGMLYGLTLTLRIIVLLLHAELSQ